MFNHKGMTLIESLFAFEIYIVVIIMFVTLLTQLYQSEIRIKNHYTQIQQKEETISYENDFTNLVNEVLH